MAKKITLKNKAGEVLCPHTAIEQVQGLKEALDDKLGKTENANSASKLNVMSFRPASANVPTADGGLYQFKATSNMTEGDPGKEGHIIHSSWDNSEWSSQLFLGADVGMSVNDRMKVRWQENGIWSDWKTVAFTDSNVASATKADTATDSSKLGGISASNYMKGDGEQKHINFNEQLNVGIFRNTGVSTDPVEGAPTEGGDYGNLMVIRSGGVDTLAQMYFNYHNNSVFVRAGNTNPSSTVFIGSRAWSKVRYMDDLVTTSHIADAAITPAKIQTSIALNGTPSMTVEPTTSSPDKTIASVGLVKEAVADLEIDTRNLIPNSASIVTGSHTTSVYHCKQIKLPVGIKNGESYSFNCDSIMNTAGAVTEYSLILYDLPNSKAASNYIHLTTENKVGYFTATRDVAVGSAYIFLYAGKYGATAGNNVTYINCSLVKGDKPMLLWQAAPEDMVSKKYLGEFEIGGTNLVPVSEFEIGGLGDYGVAVAGDNRVRSKNYIQISSPKISAKSWVSGKYGILLYFYNSSKTFIKSSYADKGWFEECQAYATPEGTAFIKVVIRHLDNSTFVGTDLSSIKIKVENGDKITDWSPAPEDIQTDITNAESRAKTYAETQVGKVATGEIVAKKASTLYDDDSGTYKNWGEIDTAITRKIGNKFEDYATKSYVQGEISKQVAVPIASETEYGKVELATPEDVTAVENDISAVNDSAKAVTPYTLKEYIASKSFVTSSELSSQLGNINTILNSIINQ